MPTQTMYRAGVRTPAAPRQGRSGDAFRRFGIERNVRSDGFMELEARCVVRLTREVVKEARHRTSIPWSRRIWAWRMGFRAIYAAMYGLDTSTARWYVPDYGFAYRSYRMGGFWNPIVGNKLVVSQVLAAHGIPHPRVLGILSRGKLREVGKVHRCPEGALLERWTDCGQTAVFRPYWSGGGEGVFLVDRQGGEWRVNGHPAEEHDVRSLLGGLDRYIVTQFVTQAEYARRVFPRTTNTLRVLVLTDDEGPFVASVAHRFGTSRSFPIDNFHQGRGGICASVAADSGVLGMAMSLSERHERIWHRTHPETGSQIEGVVVPGFGSAVDGVLAAAACFPEATCVGWDIVMTDAGFSILEANAPPGIVVSQLHAPLLANPRVARFFASYGFAVPDVLTRPTDTGRAGRID